MRRRVLMAAVLLYCLVPVCSAEQFWEKKPFRKWSNTEVAKLLTNSPWAKRFTLGTQLDKTGDDLGAGQRDRGVVPDSVGARRESSLNESMSNRISRPQITYQVQLMSAAPLRQAIARQSMLARNYDAASAPEKASADAQIAQYLGAEFPDTVVVQVAYSSTVPDFTTQLRAYWRSQTVDELKPSVSLTIGTEKVALQEFSAGDNAFRFVFARPKNAAANDILAIEFVHPNVGIRSSHVLTEFKLSDTVIAGTPTF